MKSNDILRCDGCGQVGSPEHIARRLRRLEGATRYRPVHILTLLLGGAAPREDEEFVYAPGTEGSSAGREFRGEAQTLLRAVGISLDGRPPQDIHAEFQAAGFFLTHILECPLEPSEDGGADASALMRKHVPLVASRIRRSLKPRRVILVKEIPPEVVQDILSLHLGCDVLLNDHLGRDVLLNDGKPFAFAPAANEAEIARVRALLDSRTTRK